MSNDLLDQRNNFISHLSHDVRNIVNGLEGVLTLLDITNSDSACQEYIDAARTSAHRLALILLNILETARVDSGNMQVSRIPYKIREEVAGVVDHYENIARQKGLAFSYSIDEQLPEDISGDPVILKRVLANLLDNATRYTETGSVTVELSGEEDSHVGSRLSIRVADTGPGMPAALHDVMFKPYMNSHDTPGAGSRLGLPLSFMLTSLLGGSLVYENASDGGSIFSVNLPMDVVNSSGSKPGNITEGTPREIQVLIVDDNELNSDVLAKLLAANGVIADIAMNGEEAVSRCQGKQYDLVLMDYHMPVMDGLEATQKIRQLPSYQDRTVILAMTGNDTDESRKLAAEVGMDGYYVKPIFIKVVREILDKYFPGVRKDRPKL